MNMKRWLTSEERKEWKEWLKRGTNKRKHKKPKWQRKMEASWGDFKSQRADREKKCREYLPEILKKLAEATTTSQKLKVLRKAANPPWERVHPKLLKQLRREYLKAYSALLNFDILDCPICGMEAADEKHHIIPLTFGGISEDLNLVKIGLSCHEAIHPWMADKRL